SGTVSGQWFRDQCGGRVAGPLRRPPSTAGAGWSAGAAGAAGRGLVAGTGASARVSALPRTRDSAATPHRIPIPLLTANLLDGPLTAPTVPKTLSARHIVTTTTPLGMSDCDPEFGGC